jgi:hypothetical protein
VALFHQLTSKGALLAIGISLCVVGIILRGFARDALRARAFRKQHELHERKLDEASRQAPLDAEAGWLEQSLPTIANAVALAGVAITIMSFVRK